MAQSPQCVAPGAYPLQPLRSQFRHQADHADVFPGRSTARDRSYFQQRARGRRAAAAGRTLRYRYDDARACARLPIRHGVAWPFRHPRDSGRTSSMNPRQTPSQTVGPFFRPSLIEPDRENLLREGTRGERLVIEGRVIDGDGAPVTDAMLEIWQANAEGRYDHPDDDQEKLLDPAFHGYGRAATDARGEYRFQTIKPGPVPGPGGELQAPHINVS